MRKHILLLMLLWLGESFMQVQAQSRSERKHASHVVQCRDKVNKFGIFCGPNLYSLPIDNYKDRIGIGFDVQKFYTLYLNNRLDLELSLGYHLKSSKVRYCDSVFRRIEVGQNFHYLQVTPQLNISVYTKQHKDDGRGFYLLVGGYVAYLMGITAHEKLEGKSLNNTTIPTDWKGRFGKNLNRWSFGILWGCERHFAIGFIFKATQDIGIRKVYDIDDFNLLGGMNISLGYNFGKLLT
jgi:hypothetical protein